MNAAHPRGNNRARDYIATSAREAGWA